MADIVMTVKARHIRNMRLGSKRYELRKTRPGKDGPHRVWLCESGTGGTIVASFACKHFPVMTGFDPVTVARLGAITAAEVQGYRQKGDGMLFGWEIEDFKYFKTSDMLHIVDFGLKRPPQSWCYAKEVPDYE